MGSASTRPLDSAYRVDHASNPAELCSVALSRIHNFRCATGVSSGGRKAGGGRTLDVGWLADSVDGLTGGVGLEPSLVLSSPLSGWSAGLGASEGTVTLDASTGRLSPLGGGLAAPAAGNCKRSTATARIIRVAPRHAYFSRATRFWPMVQARQCASTSGHASSSTHGGGVLRRP